MSKTNDQLYEQIKDLLEANLEPIRGDIEQINKALNGNGQPGIIERVDKLEQWRWYILGMGGVFMFLLTFFGDEVKSIIFK